ncbi:MAG: hypothetical protein QNJ62_10605, partial [Methyloceanibacter sp.]|nr:hypothetical protein [Methyloceanibacter sp.]
TPTIAIKNNWPDVESISNMRLVSNDDTDFITKRENFMEGLKSNLQSSEIVRDDDSSFSLSGEHDEFDYERPTYGFSLAIDPNGSLDKTDRDTHYLLSLVRWLAQIEGVDLYIQTSNAYEANAINYTFENSLAEKSSVSESYVAWRDRYGIEKCASVDQTTHNTNQEASYIYDKYYECVYNLGELKLTNVNFKENPLAGGFLLSTDHHDQRFYQLFPNPKLPSVSRELKKYAGNDELKGSRAFSYGRGKSEPWLANTAFAEKIWNLQKQYGSLLFVKMVRTTDDSISVPRLRHTWSSIGEPSLRNFVTSDYKEDRDGSVGNFDDNNNDDVNSHSSDSLGSENVDLDISDDDNDDDANMHSSESSLGSMSDREEKIDE